MNKDGGEEAHVGEEVARGAALVETRAHVAAGVAEVLLRLVAVGAVRAGALLSKGAPRREGVVEVGETILAGDPLVGLGQEGELTAMRKGSKREGPDLDVEETKLRVGGGELHLGAEFEGLVANSVKELVVAGKANGAEGGHSGVDGLALAVRVDVLPADLAAGGVLELEALEELCARADGTEHGELEALGVVGGGLSVGVP